MVWDFEVDDRRRLVGRAEDQPVDGRARREVDGRALGHAFDEALDGARRGVAGEDRHQALKVTQLRVELLDARDGQLTDAAATDVGEARR